MNSISAIRTTPSIDLINRGALDTIKPNQKDKGALSIANQQGLSLARPVTTPDQASTRETQAKKAAEGLVSNTFIEPILKQIRESNDAPPPFGPTKAEKQFASLLDTKLADEIVQSSNFPLVERITQQLLNNMPATQNEHNGIDIRG